MGYGEDYGYRYCEWEESLSPEQKEIYAAMFPPPPQYIDTCQAAFQKNDLVLDMWEPSGKPKYTREWAVNEMKSTKGKNLLLFYRETPVTPGRITETCLCQWYPAKFSDVHDYICAEQFMMASKAALFGDKEREQQIMKETSPAAMQKIGRQVAGFDGAEWDKIKYTVVLNASWMKFSQNYELKEYLLSTGDSILVEASPRDRVWGIGYDEKHPNAWEPTKWDGENLLGFALMEVRDKLREVCRNEHLCDWSWKK